MNICNSCKHQNVNEAKYCANCGNQLSVNKISSDNFIKNIKNNTFYEDIKLTFDLFLKNINGWILLFFSFYLIKFIPVVNIIICTLATFITIIYSFLCLKNHYNNSKFDYKDFYNFFSIKIVHYLILEFIELLNFIFPFVISLSLTILPFLHMLFFSYSNDSPDFKDFLPYIISIDILLFGIFLLLILIIKMALRNIILKDKTNIFSSIKKSFISLKSNFIKIIIYYLKMLSASVPFCILIIVFGILFINSFTDTPIETFYNKKLFIEYITQNTIEFNPNTKIDNVKDLYSIIQMHSIKNIISIKNLLMLTIKTIVFSIYNLFNTIAYFKFFYSEE